MSASSCSPPSKRAKTTIPESMQATDNDNNAAASYAMPSSSVQDLENGNKDGNARDASMLSNEPSHRNGRPKPSTKTAALTDAERMHRNKMKRIRKKPVDAGGLEETMFFEAVHLLGKELTDEAVSSGEDYRERFGKLEEIELEVVAMSSHGGFLALQREYGKTR